MSSITLVLIGFCLLNIVYEVSTDSDVTVPNTLDRFVEDVTVPAQVNSDPVIERSSHYHHHSDPTYRGFWKKKFVWRPRWVKTWQEKKIYVAVWKRMWSPSVLNEWVPIPKPPPGWIKHGGHNHGGSVYVKKYPH